MKRLAMLVLAAAASSAANAADTCTFDTTGSGGIMSSWMQEVNPQAWIQQHPECYNPDSVDSAALDALTKGRRTSGSTMPDRCVMPANAVPFLGACVGHMCAQVWQDIIICDKNGNRLTQGATPQGAACERARVGEVRGQNVVCPAKPLHSFGFVTHECSGQWSTCVQLTPNPQGNGNGVWINTAGPSPISKNPAVHEITVENLTSCDGDHDYGTAYSFSSREDICSGMGLDGGKIFRRCTAHPCPNIVGAMWPNGKLRCNEIGDGLWAGTCLFGTPYCKQWDDGQPGGFIKGSQCHDGGPDVVDGAVAAGGARYVPPSYTQAGPDYPNGSSLVSSGYSARASNRSGATRVAYAARPARRTAFAPAFRGSDEPSFSLDQSQDPPPAPTCNALVCAGGSLQIQSDGSSPPPPACADRQAGQSCSPGEICLLGAPVACP